MTVTNQNLQLEAAGWAVNSSVTSTSAEIVKAAPGSGKFIHLKELGIYTSARGTVTVQSRLASSATATLTTIAGPISFGSSNFDYSQKYIRAIRLPENEELLVSTAPSSLVNVFASGEIK